MIVGGSKELLSEELEEQKAKTQKLENERAKKFVELEGCKKKVADLKQWLNTLLTMSESQLDIIPQVRSGLAEIEALRENNYELRKRLFAEKRRYDFCYSSHNRTDTLKQEYFRVKKKAKEQQITLNDIDKGVLILEKESLAEKINALSAEVDRLSSKNVEYARMMRMNEHELGVQYEESLKHLMKLKSEHLNLLNSLAFYADTPFPHAGGEIRPR